MKKVIEVTAQREKAEHQAQQIKFWEKIMQDQKEKIKAQALVIETWDDKDDK